MTAYGFKVSKETKDARTVTGQDLVISSEDNSPKIILEGSGQITNSTPYATTPTGKTIISHGLGFVPSYDLFFKPSGTTKWHAHKGRYNFDGDTYADLVDWWVTVDTNNLTIYSEGDTARTHDFYYMILADLAKLGGAGNNSATGFGLRISQSGYDIDDDDDKQVFIMADTYKPSIIKSIPVTVPTIGTETIISVGHGLGYSPAFTAMASGDVNTSLLNIPYAFTSAPEVDLRVYSDDGNITAYVRNLGTSDTIITFEIVLFENALV